MIQTLKNFAACLASFLLRQPGCISKTFLQFVRHPHADGRNEKKFSWSPQSIRKFRELCCISKLHLHRYILVTSIISLVSLSSVAFETDINYQGEAQWNEFRDFVLKQQAENETLGKAYMISGVLAAIGGSVGYYQSEEVFSRTVFAITSNLGIAAIGLGASYLWTGSQMDSFFYAIDGSSLSLHEKNEVLRRYLYKEQKEKEHRRWIKVATHALIAALNIYTASQETSPEVRSVFYFLGGANALLAVSYSF